MVRHAVTVWLALLGMVVQLTAAGACTAGAGPGSGSAGPFPICHVSHADPSGGHGPGDQSPASGADCPFCTIHCHAAVALAPTLTVPTMFVATSIEGKQTVPVGAPRSHVCTGVLPRGPPRHA